MTSRVLIIRIEVFLGVLLIVVIGTAVVVVKMVVDVVVRISVSLVGLQVGHVTTGQVVVVVATGVDISLISGTSIEH